MRYYVIVTNQSKHSFRAIKTSFQLVPHKYSQHWEKTINLPALLLENFFPATGRTASQKYQLFGNLALGGGITFV